MIGKCHTILSFTYGINVQYRFYRNARNVATFEMHEMRETRIVH